MVTSAVATATIAITPSVELTRWDFNETNDYTPVNPAPSLGSGTAIPGPSAGATNFIFAPGALFDPAQLVTDSTNAAWELNGFNAGISNKTAGFQYNVSTVGYTNILLTWSERHSATASKYMRVQYSTNGVDFLDGDVITFSQVLYQFYSSDLSAYPGAANNPNFAFRIVAEWESTAIGTGNASYAGTSSGFGGTGTIREDLVTVFWQPPRACANSSAHPARRHASRADMGRPGGRIFTAVRAGPHRHLHQHPKCGKPVHKRHHGIPAVFSFEIKLGGLNVLADESKKAVCCFCLLAALSDIIALRAAKAADDFSATTETVGHATNGFVTPVNQRITPAGIFVELPGMRPNALALSPDEKILVTAGLSHELVVVNPMTGEIMQRVPFPADAVKEEKPVVEGILNADEKGQLSFTGLTFSPDGSRIYLANVNGDIKVFSVGTDEKISPLISFALPPANAPVRKEEIPAGIAVSLDGKKIYVCGNLSNRLFELDAATGKVLRTWDVGVAPFNVVPGKNKIYVSNWGGRRPDTNSMTGPIGEDAPRACGRTQHCQRRLGDGD